MSCKVAALPFQALANYGNWSIDFDDNRIIALENNNTLLRKLMLYKIYFGNHV